MIGSFFQNKSHQTYEAKLAKQIRQQQETERKSFSNLQKREYKLTKEQMKKVSDKKMDIFAACMFVDKRSSTFFLLLIYL